MFTFVTLTGNDAWRSSADQLFDALLPHAASNMFAHAGLLNALDLRLRTTEIVVTGTGPQADALADAALALPYLNRVLMRAQNPELLPADHPARDKIAAAPAGAAFVCIGSTCSLPVTDPQALRTMAPPTTA